MKSVGIPYMGSKRKLAPQIIEHILLKHPNTKYIYDLFGGGAAVSLYALQKDLTAFYNDIDTGIVELLKDIQTNGIRPEYYQWIDRATFHKHKHDNTWFGGLVKSIWSFGNNGQDYLYGTDIENYKKQYTEIVVNGIDHTKELSAFAEDYVLKKHNIEQKCTIAMPTKTDYQERRLEIRKQLNVFEKACKLTQVRRLQQLQQIEALQQLERLEPVGLNITNLSYELVPITTPIEETIIYCDPPYKDTGKYQNDIDHQKFYDWVKNHPYTIYLSSYDAPFNQTFAMAHRTTLSASAAAKSLSNSKTIEKLYCNK